MPRASCAASRITNEGAPSSLPAVPDSAASLGKGLAFERTDHVKEHILQFFAFDHLPPHLAAVSRPFAVLAHDIVGEPLSGVVADTSRALPRNPERTVALRKLLEAKDAAVRALIAKDQS